MVIVVVIGPHSICRSAWPFLLMGALVTLIAGPVCASNILIEDDFTGTDGDLPDPKVWNTIKQDDNDAVEILDDQLLTHTYSMGHARAELLDYVMNNEFTILVDYYVTNIAGRPFDIAVSTMIDDLRKGMVTFCYDPGYGWHVYYRVDNNITLYVSYRTTLATNTWYVMNVTITKDGCDISVTEKDTQDLHWSWSTDRLDPLLSENYIRFGGFAPNPGQSPRALWDNFKLINLGPDLVLPPRWGDLPVIHAVEDVPLAFNFSSNVSDPDTPMRRLDITSDSPYFQGCDNLTCTFVFPNGVTRAEVVLTLTDGLNQVTKTVLFIIEPVNDPPECTVPTEHVAVEDVQYSVVFTPYVSDVDNELADLFLEVTSPYASANGLILTVLYLEGILDDNLTVWLSDGTARTEVTLHFTIMPVDDPPTIAALGELTVIEDEASTFDVGPFIDDIDTPLEELVVVVDDAKNCSVTGHVMSMLFQTGGHSIDLTVSVTDGRSFSRAVLVVHVQAMNDAPLVGPVPLQYFSEGQEKTVDLSPYVSDEDNLLSTLSLECTHHALTSIEGLKMTLMFPTWEPNQTVEFRVFDSIAKTSGSFTVVVHDVNLPPKIIGVGKHVPPVVILAEEGLILFLPVKVQDEDSSSFLFTITSDWSSLVMHANGTLEVKAPKGSRGDQVATIGVDDMAGGTDSLDIIVRVIPRNRPPSDPVILSPENGSVFKEGEEVEFKLLVTDPDVPLGDILTIVWTSNLSGDLRYCTHEDSSTFTTSELDVGVHVITVAVSDGEFDRTAWIEITVEAVASPNGGPYPPGPDPPDVPELSLAERGLLIILAVCVVAVVAYLYVWRRHHQQE